MYLRFVLVRLMCCSYINLTHSAKFSAESITRLPGNQGSLLAGKDLCRDCRVSEH